MKKSLFCVAAATAISLVSAHANANPNDAGFYIGAIIGFGEGAHDTELLDNDHMSKGAVGGVKAGYQMKTSNLLLGLEADYSISQIESNAQVSFSPFPGASSVTEIQHKVKNYGSVRGKIGLPLNNFTPYLTAGFAFADNKSSATARINGFGPLDGQYVGSHEQKHSGKVIGVGVDVPFSSTLFLNAEYLYSDLGTETYSALPTLDPTPRTHDVNIRMIRLGLSYKF